MNARAFAVIAVALAGASCQLVYGLDDFHADTSEGGGSSSRGDSSSETTRATGSTGHTGTGTGTGTGGGGEGGGFGGGGGSCADPCTAGPPTGWGGPFAVRHEDATITPTPCDEGDAVVLMGDAVPLDCTPCGCQITDAHCVGPTLDSFAFQSCSVHTDTSNSGCVSAISARASGTAKLVGGCAATGGERTGGFATRYTLCAPPASTCDAPCAPPAGSDLCIERDGDATCPDGWGTRTVVYERAQDTFMCEACTCDTRLACADAWIQKPGLLSDCDASGTPLATNTCSDGTFFYSDTPTGPAGCTPNGVGSMGNYTPVGAHTVCCR